MRQTSYDPSGAQIQSTADFAGTSPVKSDKYYYGPLAELTENQTLDANGAMIADSIFKYDENSLVATTGIPQHSSVSGSRGNLTSTYVNTGNGQLETHATYYDTGTVATSTAPDAGVNSYTYDFVQGFVTQTSFASVPSGVALSSAQAHDLQAAVLTSWTGFNSGQTTTIQQYDALLRPTLISSAWPGATTAISYSPTQTIVSAKLDSSRSTQQVAVVDGYGRTIRTAGWNGSAYYLRDVCFDAAGLAQYVGTAYVAASLSAGSNCTNGDTYSCDALGRATHVDHADGSATTWIYNSKAVKQSDTPGTSKITQYDVLGRQSAVCELSSNASMPSLGAPSSCGLDIAGSGFLTTMTYDLASHQVTTTQGAQTRIVQTDWVGRPVSVQEPERGNTAYSYSYNGTGAIVVRTRHRQNQVDPNVLTHTTSQYDHLGRLASVTYDDNLTPNKAFTYDQAPGGCKSAKCRGEQRADGYGLERR